MFNRTMKNFKHSAFKKKHLLQGAFFLGSASLLYAGVAAIFTPLSYEANPGGVGQGVPSVALEATSTEPALPQVVHVKIPDAVKAAYMSSCVAATPSIRARVVDMVNRTEINSIVIDVKDFSGYLSYVPTDEKLRQPNDNVRSCRIPDIRGLIADLHKDNIYVIGRVAVFQDPYFVKQNPDLAVRSKSKGGAWKDHKGLVWVDASSRQMWNYSVAISKDAYSQGFDEINFDYIRFPSDGSISDMSFPISGDKDKAEVMESYYEFLNGEMKTAGITTSADIFGMTTTSLDDLNIGQVLESALANFDYVAPMVYPSHYPKGFNNWSNPNAHPYDLIHFVMSAASERVNKATTTPLKLRPWLQDFSLGSPKYGKAEVEAQIQATYDAGLTSWMLWDPSNKYAGGALLPE